MKYDENFKDVVRCFHQEFPDLSWNKLSDHFGPTHNAIRAWCDPKFREERKNRLRKDREKQAKLPKNLRHPSVAVRQHFYLNEKVNYIIKKYPSVNWSHLVRQFLLDFISKKGLK